MKVLTVGNGLKWCTGVGAGGSGGCGIGTNGGDEVRSCDEGGADGGAEGGEDMVRQGRMAKRVGVAKQQWSTS